jgi:hypothetical protein
VYTKSTLVSRDGGTQKRPPRRCSLTHSQSCSVGTEYIQVIFFEFTDLHRNCLIRKNVRLGVLLGTDSV